MKEQFKLQIIFYESDKGSVVNPDPPGTAFIWMSWIRIRIGNANANPRAWRKKTDKNLQINLVFCRVGIKKPTQKNPPKKTQKNPPKKTH